MTLKEEISATLGPTHVLEVQTRDGSRKNHIVGSAWLRSDGSLSIRLNLGVERLQQPALARSARDRRKHMEAALMITVCDADELSL